MRRPPFLDQGEFCTDTSRKVQSRILCPWRGLRHIGTWAYRPPVNNQDTRHTTDGRRDSCAIADPLQDLRVGRLIASRYEPETDTVSIIQSAIYTALSLVWRRAYGLTGWVSDVASVLLIYFSRVTFDES